MYGGGSLFPRNAGWWPYKAALSPQVEKCESEDVGVPVVMLIGLPPSTSIALASGGNGDRVVFLECRLLHSTSKRHMTKATPQKTANNSADNCACVFLCTTSN